MPDPKTAFTLILNIFVFYGASLAINYFVGSIRSISNNEISGEACVFISIAIHIIVFIILLIALSGGK